MADQSEDGNVVSQRFTGGEISWDKQSNKFSTQPANLASGLVGLSVPGYEPSESPQAAPSESKGRNWLTPSWWWLLAGIPLLVLVGLVLAATLRNRGGGDIEPLDDDFDVDTTHDSAAEAEAVRLAGSDVLGSVRLADGYSRPSALPTFGVGGVDSDPFAPAGDDSDEFSELEPEADDSDTAPTRIPSEADTNSGRHSTIQLEEPPDDFDEPAALPPDDAADNSAPDAQTAIHLPLDDPYLAPTGYPIKADTKSGLYWRPDSELYDHVPAEVYFVNEEFARANGFVKAD